MVIADLQIVNEHKIDPYKLMPSVPFHLLVSLPQSSLEIPKVIPIKTKMKLLSKCIISGSGRKDRIEILKNSLQYKTHAW